MIANDQGTGGYVLCYDGERIPFRVEFRERKKLGITVHPELRLEVAAPMGGGIQQVLDRIEKRAGWILRQWRYFERFQPPHPGHRYRSGESHLYLGRQYRLKLRTGKAESVKLVGPFLHLWTAELEDSERIQALLRAWYRERAEHIFPYRLALCLERFPALGLAHQPRLTIRRMTRRWGSCSKAGHVLLNLDLIKVPTHCIDYVITHELCHLLVHNHRPAFYRLLSRAMPDWERRKMRLEELVV